LARFSYEQQLTSTADVPACQAAVVAELQTLAARIESTAESTNGQIRARMGSQFRVRLLGGFLAPRSAYPIAVAVRVRDQGGQRIITVHVAEAFGFGTIRGVEARYRSYCQDVLQRLSQGIAARLPAVGTQVTQDR
jgi:hypothetical protein